MNEVQERCYEILLEVNDSERVAGLFLDWLGLQVLDEDFLEFLKEELY